MLNFNILNILSKLNPNGQAIELEGNCKITNYKNASALVKNPFTIIKKDGEVTVNGLAQQEYKDIESSVSVFSRIASMDGNTGNLTAEDLKLARQDYNKNKSVWKTLGVSSFKYDPNEGIANLTIGKQTLRVDFDTPKQKSESKKEITKESQSNSKTGDKKPAKTNTNTNTNATTAASETNSKLSAGKTQSKAKTKNLPDKYAGIKKAWIPFIKDTAKKYGYSEDLIISKVLYEGFTPVAKHKNEGGKGGLVEVGFGHTTNANHNNKFKAGFKISLQQAFDWLGQDIKDKEAKIKEFGDYYDYDNLPQPLKEMMIDVAFNRGEGKLNPKLMLTEEEKQQGKKQIFDENYKSVRANILKKYWGSAAVRLRQEVFPKRIIKEGKEGGLRKRNVQRFLKLMDYLTPEKVVGAMDLFNREYYYTKTLNMLKKAEADTLQQQWNNIYYNAKAKCTK